MNKIFSKGVLERLQTLLGVDNDSKLALALGVNRQTLGSWRTRDSVPYELCVSIAMERGVSLDWLLTGDGEMLKVGKATHLDEAARQKTTPREEAMLALFRQLSEDEQQDIQKAAQEKKRLREVEQRLEEMTALLARRRYA